jgi:NDP-sugar pyrophosphorylase family protein
VINGDSLIVPERGIDCYEELYYGGSLYGKSSCAMFTCKKDNDGSYGALYIDDDGWVSSFESEKRDKSWINCGWYIFRHEFFDHYRNPICTREKIQIYDVERISLEKDFFPNYIGSGETINPLVIDKSQFIEIGTPEALEDAARRLQKE